MTWPVPPNTGGNNVSDNYDSLLGGRATPSASFKGQFPVLWEGVVEEASKKPAFEYDPSKPNNRGAQKFWQDGNPVENLWITLRTNVRTDQDDDGRRVLVLDSKNKVEAVQQAVRESGASFAKGGLLTIEWYGNDPNGKNPDNPPKLYRARYQGPTLDAALGQAGPPTPATSAPQANWGGQAPAASPQQGTGGWGNPPAQQAPAAPAWGAQPAAPATTPAAGPTVGAAGGWGAAAPAPAPAAWGSPAPVAPPTFDQLLAQGGPAAVLEALRKKGVPADQVTSPEQAAQLWALVQNNPDVTA